MSKFLMGIDIGTSACKVAAFDLEGRVVAQASEPYHVHHLGQGWVEQDPLEWWEKVCRAVQSVLAALKSQGAGAAQISAIGVDGQSWSAIPVDVEGNVLHNTPNWMDSRASSIAERVKSEIGNDRIAAVSGNSFEPTYSTPKILWFKEYRPEIFRRTDKFLQSNSYAVYRADRRNNTGFVAGLWAACV